VVVNEMTTVASVWTHAQFLDGSAIKGNPLGLKIAAGNVPNFVNLETGGWGSAIQDTLNSAATPTMANFATLATILAGCTTKVKPNACDSLFAATTSPAGKRPADTLAAAHFVALNSAYQPERLFALLDEFYPVPQGKTLRATSYLPYPAGVVPSSTIEGTPILREKSARASPRWLERAVLSQCERLTG